MFDQDITEIIEPIETIELAKNNEDIIETNEENAVIDNSPYSISLNRLLEMYKEAIEMLQKNIDKLDNSGRSVAIPIITFVIAVIIFSYGLISNQIEITRMISLGSFTTSVITGAMIYKKEEKKAQLLRQQLKSIESINNYLESELIISREYSNILSNSKILEKQKMHIQELEMLLNDSSYLQDFDNIYLEEIQKNIIIIDCLKTLNDSQKKNYLKRIYSEINEHFEKSNIDLNEDDLLLKDDNNNNTPMLTTNTLPNENAKDKGISLNKEHYPINNFNELNDIFNGDIMPPMFQKEKGHQFSKKFPN